MSRSPTLPQLFHMSRIATLLAGCCLLALAGCGGGPSPAQVSVNSEQVPLPPSPGIYAYDGDNLTRLDGPADWERSTWSDRSDLSPKTEFLVYEPALATDPTTLSSLIQLRRVAHVRNQISATGQVGPAQNSRWGAPDLPEYRVALLYLPAPGHPDVLVAKPSDQLGQGLYSFNVLTQPQPISARIGVDWPSIDQNQYAATHCVDSYPQGYRRCSDSDARVNDPAAGVALAAGTSPTAIPVSSAMSSRATVATAPAPVVTTAPAPAAAPPPGMPAQNSQLSNLAIRGLHSARTNVAGETVLVVEGDFVNTSSAQLTLPQRFTLGLVGNDGTVLESIPVADLPPTVLGPNEVYHFRTEVADPPANAARVRLTPAA